jgi:ParB family transcriptional regulator, chromosome partitioning protein
MANSSKLGRGLDVLIPKELDSDLLQEDKNRVQKLFIDEVMPNPDQPRGQIDQTALSELTNSVKRHGVLQPIIVVRAKGQNGYTIVAGERRWRAAKAADLRDIPAIVRSLEELEQIEIALIENIQRVDLSPLEQAVSVFKLQQQFNMTLEEIAKKLGKAPSTISNLTRLLGLPEAAREALRQGKISEGHARAILALKAKTAHQDELLHCILNNGWNVRRAEQFVTEVRKSIKQSPVTENQAVVEKLSTDLGTEVKIKPRGTGGQLIIQFKDEKQLQKIAQKLQK